MLALLLSLSLAQAGQAHPGGGGCVAGKSCSAKDIKISGSATSLIMCMANGNATRPAYAWYRNVTAIELRQCADSRCASCPTTAWSIDPTNALVGNAGTDGRLFNAYDLQFRNRFVLNATWPGISSFNNGYATTREIYVNAQTFKLWWGENSASYPFRPLGSESHPIFDGAAMTIRAGQESATCPLVIKALPTNTAGTAATLTCTATGGSIGTIAGTSRSYSTLTTQAADEAFANGVTETIVQPKNWPRACQWVRTGSAITGVRYWVGLSSTAFAADDDLPTTRNVVAFRFSTEAGDSTWQFVTCQTSTNGCTATNTTVAVAANTEYMLCAELNGVSRAVYMAHADGATQVQGSVSTNIIVSASTNLLWNYAVQSETAVTARVLGLSSANIEAR